QPIHLELNVGSRDVERRSREPAEGVRAIPAGGDLVALGVGRDELDDEPERGVVVEVGNPCERATLLDGKGGLRVRLEKLVACLAPPGPGCSRVVVRAYRPVQVED